MSSIGRGSSMRGDIPVPSHRASTSEGPRTTSTSLRMPSRSRKIRFGILFLSRNSWSPKLKRLSLRRARFLGNRISNKFLLMSL